MTNIQADYCVIGAGYSGLAAALRLKQTGSSVIVVEARDRVGGRIFSHQLSDGTSFDIGGAWVSDWPAQPHIRNLMQQVEGITGTPIKMFTQYEKGMNVLVRRDGQKGYYDATAPLLAGLPDIGEAGKLEVAAFIATLSELSTYLTPDTPWVHIDFPEDAVLLAGGAPASSTEADQMTLLEAIDTSFDIEEAKQLMYTLFSNLLGKELAKVSLLHMLYMLRTFSSDIKRMTGSGENQAEHYRLHGGAQQMALYIHHHLGDSVHLNQPVQKITNKDNEVVIETAGLCITAKRAIVAVPVSLVDKITFDPLLPPARVQLQSDFGMGCVWKIWVAYDTPFWREPGYLGQKDGLSGESVTANPDNFIMTTLDGSEDTTATGLLVAFVGGAKGMIFQQKTREERRAIILQELAWRFGDAAGKPSTNVHFLPQEPQNPVADAYFEWNWTIEQYTHGAFAGIPGAGTYTQCGETLRQPIGRVHWAGVDTSTYPYASMSGAVQAGERAATEAVLAEDASKISGKH